MPQRSAGAEDRRSSTEITHGRADLSSHSHRGSGGGRSRGGPIDGHHTDVVRQRGIACHVVLRDSILNGQRCGIGRAGFCG